MGNSCTLRKDCLFKSLQVLFLINEFQLHFLNRDVKDSKKVDFESIMPKLLIIIKNSPIEC